MKVIVSADDSIRYEQRVLVGPDTPLVLLRLIGNVASGRGWRSSSAPADSYVTLLISPVISPLSIEPNSARQTACLLTAALD